MSIDLRRNYSYLFNEPVSSLYSYNKRTIAAPDPHFGSSGGSVTSMACILHGLQYLQIDLEALRNLKRSHHSFVRVDWLSHREKGLRCMPLAVYAVGDCGVFLLVLQCLPSVPTFVVPGR